MRIALPPADTLVLPPAGDRFEFRSAEGLLRSLQGFVERGGHVDPSRIPATKPAILDFVADPEGYLWVAPWPRASANRTLAPLYDVFDPQGRYLGEVRSPAPLATVIVPPVFEGDHLYGFTVDEMMVPYLVRFRIERRR